MDPLAGGDYPGEWIPVARSTASPRSSIGRSWRQPTPAGRRPRTAPLTDRAYRLERIQLSGSAVAGSAIVVQVGLSIGYGFPNPAAHRFVASLEPVLTPAARRHPTGPSRAVVDRRARPVSLPRRSPIEAVTTASAPVRAGPTRLRAALAVPSVRRAVRASTSAWPRSAHRTLVRTFRTMVVSRPAAVQRGVIGAADGRRGHRGSAPCRSSVAVANIGTFDWRPAARPSDDPRPGAPAARDAPRPDLAARGPATSSRRPACRWSSPREPRASSSSNLIAPDQAGTLDASPRTSSTSSAGRSRRPVEPADDGRPRRSRGVSPPSPDPVRASGVDPSGAFRSIRPSRGDVPEPLDSADVRRASRAPPLPPRAPRRGDGGRVRARRTGGAGRAGDRARPTS